MYHNFFIHSSVDGHLGCFHVLAIANSATVNAGVHVSFSILVSSGYMPRSGIAGSHGTAKAVPRGRFIAIQSYIKKQERHWLDNLTLHLKQLEKEEQKNPRVSGKKEIIKIRVEINEKEMKETVVKINKTESWFFEKVNRIDKPFSKR